MAAILVADDDPDIREIVALILEVAGHEVSTVADGPAAVAAIRHQAYDLVVLDNTMPVMSGLEVLRICQDLEPCRRPIFLMLSALNGRRDVRAALDAGADSFLPKPFEGHRLVTCIHDLLEAGRLEQPAGC
ncbi:response regulator [Nocardioides psychrotolerans]|uniref:response regulator n=1 Tax=Nocardioides psychrotolerans TaxID=1005945 RepID=UPI00313839FB